MTLPLIWSDEALDEFLSAEAWYANVSAELSSRFVQAVEITAALIEKHPLRFPIVHRNRRRVLLPQFPYGLFYQIEPERILIIACFHGKRNPRLWQQR